MQKPQRRFQQLLQCVVGCLLILFCTAQGCKTLKPSSDSTAPTVYWLILLPEGGSTKITDLNGTFKAKYGKSYTVGFYVNDKQGVHEIHLTRSGGYSCLHTGPESAVSNTADISTGQHSVLKPDSSNYVQTTAAQFESINTSYSCQAGTFFQSATIVLKGTGKNYFNGEKSSTLTISVGK